MFSKQLQVGFLASVRLGKGLADILHDRAATKNGSGTFRSSVFSLLGAKVPTENFRSRERKFPGTKVLGNCSREQELSFPSKQVRFLTTVIDIYNTQMLGAAVKKVHIFE